MNRIFLLSAIVFFSTQVQAQSLPDKRTLEQKIDSLFQRINNDKSPGIAVTVIHDSKIIASKDFGMANLEHKVAFTHQTPVRLGYSGAREFMCAGLAMMEADELLRFDDQVKKYFPKLPAWSADVTIQDLLNHSSGFDDEWATMLLMQAHMDNRVDKEQLLTLLYNQPRPQVEPGKGYMYSNSDFALLRMIMEKASGKSLPDYLQLKLFAPSGMNATFMNDYLDQIIPGLADKYYGSEKYFKQVGVKTSPGGNYRIVTTAADLEKWATALEDSSSIAAKAIRRLYKNARPIPVLSPEVHYVFGQEWHKIGNTDIIKHGGVNQDYYMTRIPSKKITIIGLGNSFHNMTLAMSLSDVLLNKKSISTKAAPPAQTSNVVVTKNELVKHAGRYFEQIPVGHSSHLPNIRFYDIKLEGDSLHFYYTSNEFFTMIPVGENLFKDPDFGTIMQITQTHVDSAKKMQAWAVDGTTMSFVRSNKANNASTEYLQQFAGEYHSRHLDFYCRIVLNENNQLVIRRPTISDKVLVPDGENKFLFEMEAGGDRWYVVAESTKNKKGEIDGINMQHVRMMHHRFDKVAH
ncbi:serine hydrolase domain-containing protein [Lacibacter sp.]|uniref:serine hydrolase domain-containing protein n=1 Tax=Lacibacter sp. TaxID=1915409 RepID=UPI002B4B6A71|nr:serine hydrolase domain-containing protein [Lacibacter sp.]HLP36587.1 serine hydrolase domain-containing protein [Lacibacter sp.]